MVEELQIEGPAEPSCRESDVLSLNISIVTVQAWRGRLWRYQKISFLDRIMIVHTNYNKIYTEINLVDAWIATSTS